MTIYELAERTAEVMNQDNWCQGHGLQYIHDRGGVREQRCAFLRAVLIGGALLAADLNSAFCKSMNMGIATINDVLGLQAVQQALFAFAATDPTRIAAPMLEVEPEPVYV